MDLKNAIINIIRQAGFNFLYNEPQVIKALSILLQDNQEKIQDIQNLINCSGWRILLDARNCKLEDQIAAGNASIDKLVAQHFDETYAINLVNQVAEGLGYDFFIQTDHDEYADEPDSEHKVKKPKSAIKIILIGLAIIAALIAGTLILRNAFNSENSDSDADFTWGMHQYYIFINNTSWTKAQELCEQKGGHLATFETEDEYNTALQYIRDQKDLEDKKFYIGGKREKSSTAYYWVDANGAASGSSLNETGHWYSNLWYSNDPSYKDPNSGEEEFYMMMYQYDGAWKWFDVPDNVPDLYKQFSNKTGYICEIE